MDRQGVGRRFDRVTRPPRRHRGRPVARAATSSRTYRLSAIRSAIADTTYACRCRPCRRPEMTDHDRCGCGNGIVAPGRPHVVADKAERHRFLREELTRWLIEEGSLRRDEARRLLVRDLPAARTRPRPESADRAYDRSRWDAAAGDPGRIGDRPASSVLRLIARITTPADGCAHTSRVRGPSSDYEKACTRELASYMFKHALTHGRRL